MNKKCTSEYYKIKMIVAFSKIQNSNATIFSHRQGKDNIIKNIENIIEKNYAENDIAIRIYDYVNNRYDRLYMKLAQIKASQWELEYLKNIMDVINYFTINNPYSIKNPYPMFAKNDIILGDMGSAGHHRYFTKEDFDIMQMGNGIYLLKIENDGVRYCHGKHISDLEKKFF